jgi:hypothetical protein
MAIIPKKVENQYPFHFQPHVNFSVARTNGSKTDATGLKGRTTYQQIRVLIYGQVFQFRDIYDLFTKPIGLDFVSNSDFIEPRAVFRWPDHSLQIRSGSFRWTW